MLPASTPNGSAVCSEWRSTDHGSCRQQQEKGSVSPFKYFSPLRFKREKHELLQKGILQAGKSLAPTMLATALLH